MPKINGIRTAEKYREWYEDTIIIFLTSYEDYVFEGYKVNAFRYLKKPMEQEKLWEALLSAVSKLEKEYEIELWDEGGTAYCQTQRYYLCGDKWKKRHCTDRGKGLLRENGDYAVCRKSEWNGFYISTPVLLC